VKFCHLILRYLRCLFQSLFLEVSIGSAPLSVLLFVLEVTREGKRYLLCWIVPMFVKMLAYFFLVLNLACWLAARTEGAGTCNKADCKSGMAGQLYTRIVFFFSFSED